MAVYILPAAVQQAFTLPERRLRLGAVGIGEGRIVFKVDKVTPPATARAPEGSSVSKRRSSS